MDTKNPEQNHHHDTAKIPEQKSKEFNLKSAEKELEDIISKVAQRYAHFIEEDVGPDLEEALKVFLQKYEGDTRKPKISIENSATAIDAAYGGYGLNDRSLYLDGICVATVKVFDGENDIYAEPSMQEWLAHRFPALKKELQEQKLKQKTRQKERARAQAQASASLAELQYEDSQQQHSTPQTANKPPRANHAASSPKSWWKRLLGL